MRRRHPLARASARRTSTRVASTAADLDSLIMMVPPKFYFPPDPDELAKARAPATPRGFSRDC